jgi:predicted GH43/DUF377 family glycosyl hydrolase
MTEKFGQLEKIYKENLADPLAAAKTMGEAELVIGTPFYNETETLLKVVETALEAVEVYYPSNRVVLVCAGAPAGTETLGALNSSFRGSPVPMISFTFKHWQLNGRGWAIRALMDLAYALGADLVLLEADLLTGREKNAEGFQKEWLHSLWQPIAEWGFDLVLAQFVRHYTEAPISRHLVYPLLVALYNYKIRDPLSGVMAVRNKLLRELLQDPRVWHSDVGGYGADVWILTKAIEEEAKICETLLGQKLHRLSAGKREVVFRQVTSTLFERYIAYRDRIGNYEASPLQTADVYGKAREELPLVEEPHPSDYVARFRQGLDRFYSTLLPKVLTEETFKQLVELAEMPPEKFHFSSRLWAQIVYSFLIAFQFEKEIMRGDLLNALASLYQGRVAGWCNEISGLKQYLERLAPEQAERLVSLEAERLLEEQVQSFILERPAFMARWKEEESRKPSLPKVSYHEFIPGVPLLLPQEVAAASGETANLTPIYERVFRRYQEGFQRFIHERLGLPRSANSETIAEAVRNFLRHGEELLGQELLIGDLHEVEGTRQVVETIFFYLPHNPVFALKPELIAQLLWAYPPVNFMTKFGYESVEDLLNDWSPQDVLALASWSEEREYMDQVWSWLKENAAPHHFIATRLKPLVVSHEDFPSLAEMKEASALSRLTGTVVVSNLRKGTGGEFPRLRYFTLVGKNIVEAERFSAIWQQYAHERKDFAQRVINSLVGHWGRSPLSAHNFFENGHQRTLIARVREMARELYRAAEREKRENLSRLANFLEDMASSYYLAQTLPDGRFIPCSAWTWASYSFKGGRGVPTPLSLHVERDWFTRELLEEVYAALGGDPASIEARIAEMMGEGREHEELVEELLGTPIQKTLVVAQRLPARQPPAGKMTRYIRNPILTPIPEHWWESKYVLNAGGLRINGRAYLFYRAVGEDDVSRIGLAISSDGLELEERLPEPVFSPIWEEEKKGCEDPRVVRIDDRIYMLYTAYDGVTAQIALASISCQDFLARRWGGWVRHGMVFPGVWNKDAILFPAKFNGKYALYHRIIPSIWLTYSDELSCPWPTEHHRIVIGPRSGMMWDAMKIGAGTQPLLTRYGWLIIYHGVDYSRVYRLGVLVVSPDDPGEVLYRSPNAILEPETPYEIGKPGQSWVPNVVFTCGAVPREDKEILDAEDEILVYYGAADTVIGVALAKVGDLIPPEVRAKAKELKPRG